jgi:CRISPR-associated endonuclease Cas1
VRVRVERGRLQVSDGIGPRRREGQFPRAGSGLRRLVVLGHTGALTFDALRWLADTGVGFAQLDGDGRLLAASGDLGRDDPRLRRAQALAIDGPSGDDVARRLLAEKLAGQATTLARLGDRGAIGDDTVATIRKAAERLHGAVNRDELRLAEAQAAVAYWAAWAPVAVRFARRDVARVPDGWLTFGTRRSPLTGNPRLAANPANAILNYLYAILEAEARLACLAVGLDPGLGVLHADLKARDSLALDVMEAVRPQVDAYVLDLLDAQVFRADDFHETRQGVCRVLEPLTHRLAETAPVWARALGPVVERVAALFAASPESRARPQPTPLTGTNRSLGRGRDQPRVRQTRPRPGAKIAARCAACGAATARRDRQFCEACLPAELTSGAKTLAVTGPRALAALRAEGRDPAHGGEVERKRSEARRRRYDEKAAWDGDLNEYDAETFCREIIPSLQAVSLNQMAAATGLTKGYLSFVRRGRYVPHPRWWETLRQVAAPKASGKRAVSARADHASRAALRAANGNPRLDSERRR